MMRQFETAKWDTGYLRLPGPLALILGPVRGGLYVLFLPSMGIVMVAVLIAQRLAQAVKAKVLSLKESTNKY